MLFATHSEFVTVWLFTLLVIWSGILLGSFIVNWAGWLLGKLIANWTDTAGRPRSATWLHLGSSLTLVLAAWSWYVVARATPSVSLFALLVALGMTLGLLGDLLLADALPLKQEFLAGMAAFALGHIAYIAAILSLTPRVLWAVEGVALLVALLGWYLVVFRGADATLLRWAALPYALLVATTAGVAVGLAIQTPTFLPLAIGAALFLVSDLLVAGERFGGLRFPHIGDAVWLTYGPAQMLIVYAVNSALVVAAAR